MQWVCLAVRQLLILASLTVIKGMEPSIQVNTLRFTNEPNSTVYVQNNANSSFFVPCEAAGDAPLKTGWRNETVLNSRVVINTTTKGLWFIHGVQRLGSSRVHRVGIFRCMAYNTAGVVMSKKFQFNYIYLENISAHLSSPAMFSNVVRLKCNVETNQPVKYTWFKDDIALRASRNRRLDSLPSGVLRIRDYNISDDGNYSCRAENPYKAITSRSVKVVGQATSKTGIHIYPGKIIETMVGDPLTIECIHSSPQKSFVTWSKLTAQGSRKLVTQAGSADFVFDAVQKSDAGKYRCLAANGEEETVVVSVGAAPSFTNRLPATTILNEREVLVLTCNVSGSPTPSVKWYRNGRALVEGSQTHFNRSGSELQLVVKNPASGVYQCEAENKYGSSIDQTIVDVIEKMDPPQNVKAFALSPFMVNITWKIPPGYGTVFFVVHVYHLVRLVDFQEVTGDNTTHHLIRNLSPHTKYAIFVRLYAGGKARGQSSVVWVRSLETKPTGPPNEVELTSYCHGTLDVTWLPPFILLRNGEIIGYEIVYSMEGDVKENNVTVTRKFYSTTLGNLVEGATYSVRIGARTKKGLGPFSPTISAVVSRQSTRYIIPAPLVSFRTANKSIMVMVSPPFNVKVKKYMLTYRFLNDYLGEEKVVTIEKTQFEYELQNIELNLEYVITVTAFDSEMNKSRPAIVVVATENVPVKMNYTMFRKSNYSDLPRMEISCEPILNSTAIFVTWQKVPTTHVPEFQVQYRIYAETTQAKPIITKYHNVTLYDVLPGNTYSIEVRTIFRQHPMIPYSSTSRLRGTRFCKVPEKLPETPPSEITCAIAGNRVEVNWKPPTKPNGQIHQYNIVWPAAKNRKMNMVVTVDDTFRRKESYSKTLKNVKRVSTFIVTVSAENSAGQSPFGYCIVDTTKMPTVPSTKSNDAHRTDTDDIEKGIIIGCIISVLVLFLLVLFVCWSGCRRHKNKRQMKKNSTLSYYKSRNTPYPDTVSTEVSELSAKQHHIIGKKYGDEETSKESDRGVGMTPKSSRLYLNSEKIPFLPRAVNPDGSVDTSCDSQDSGVQGLGKKLSPTQVALKDLDKTPLRSKDCLVETIF